jgi:hypothetical protein
LKFGDGLNERMGRVLTCGDGSRGVSRLILGGRCRRYGRGHECVWLDFYGHRGLVHVGLVFDKCVSLVWGENDGANGSV